MPSKLLSRLLYAQGGKCFFCGNELASSEASVEHLVATANGGRNNDDNRVACCKALNALLGSMSIKEKIRVILNQDGKFKCPDDKDARVAQKPANRKNATTLPERLEAVKEDLRRRGAARPGSTKTLKSTISALFNRELSDPELEELVRALDTAGAIVVTGSKVSYKL